MFQQDDWIDNVSKPPEAELFWNTRGRAVNIYEKKKITDLIQQGFVRCDEKTKEGSYNPVYDRGDLPSVEKIEPHRGQPTKIEDDYLEITWV